MTTGFSGTFAINGTSFQLNPSEHKWTARDNLGIDGNGHPIYPAFRQYEMSWDLAFPSDVKQLLDAYATVQNTGTVSFDLPKWGASDYIFHTYSGCTLQEPEVGGYFQGTIQDVKLLIMKVNTQ